MSQTETQAIIDTANESEAERIAREESYLRKHGWKKRDSDYQQWSKKVNGNQITISLSLAVSIQGDIDGSNRRKFNVDPAAGRDK